MSIFEQLHTEERDRALRYLSEVQVHKEEQMMTQGEIGRECMFLIDGGAQVEIDGSTVASLGPGDFFGELALLRRRLGQQPFRSATVHVNSSSTIYVAGIREFESLLDQSPTVRAEVFAQASRRGMAFPPNTSPEAPAVNRAWLGPRTWRFGSVWPKTRTIAKT